MISVRPATESDLPWLLIQLKAFSEFFKSNIELFAGEDDAREKMREVIRAHVVFVAERYDGTRMGFTGGLLTPHFMNHKITTLTELFWWVDPVHRNSRAGLMLLEAFTDYGRAHANWIMFSLQDNSPVSDRCLTRRGYRLKERAYLMEVS